MFVARSGGIQYRPFKELQLEDAALMDYISKVLAAAQKKSAKQNGDLFRYTYTLDFLRPSPNKGPVFSIIDV